MCIIVRDTFTMGALSFAYFFIRRLYTFVAGLGLLDVQMERQSMRISRLFCVLLFKIVLNKIILLIIIIQL